MESVDGGDRKSRRNLLLGILVALGLGAGGYLASSFVVFPWASDSFRSDDGSLNAKPQNTVVPSFVPIEPLMISLTRTMPVRQLRLEAELQVTPGMEREITQKMPIILDTMNTYLRAIDLSDIEDPAMMLRTRMQLLRRVQVTVGAGKVEGLLITKFLIS